MLSAVINFSLFTKHTNYCDMSHVDRYFLWNRCTFFTYLQIKNKRFKNFCDYNNKCIVQYICIRSLLKIEIHLKINLATPEKI